MLSLLSLNNFWGANHPKTWFLYLLTRAWSWVLIQSVEKMAKGLILMYLSHLVRSEGMKIWTFWPKWAESVSARRQSVEQEKVWKVSFGQPPIREGAINIFAIFRSRHFFQFHFSPSFVWKFYTPRCMNRISHLAPMSFLETVKWLWPECQIDHPANCGIWALSHFIFAIT